jgi:hypothetical protein
MTIWYILWLGIWYIFFRFGMLNQEKSGNTALDVGLVLPLHQFLFLVKLAFGFICLPSYVRIVKFSQGIMLHNIQNQGCQMVCMHTKKS